jgi:hypothetical protein
MTEVVLRPLADAFMEVGIFVAVLVAAFGWARWRYGDRLVAALARHRRAGPLVGALLGVSPGCAGAILVMPLAARGTVSFGTAIAALAATMGDSSWVIMAADFDAALTVHAVLFVTGLVTGYAVDALGIDPRAARPAAARGAPVLAGAGGPDHVDQSADQRPAAVGAPGRRPVGHPDRLGGPTLLAAARAAAAAARRPVAALGALGAPVGRVAGSPAVAAAAPTGFWALAGVGGLIGVPMAFQATDGAALTAALGGLDPYLLLGTLGTLTALTIFLSGEARFADDDLQTARATSLRAILTQGARETSFVVVWVAAAYLAWSLVHAVTGFDGSQLPLHGVAGVLVGALIGLIPGCAVQIVFTGLFLAGAMPLSTLLANAVSQDGDALLPLIALDGRRAVVATVVTTVPGLLVGAGALLLL